jgi:phosphate transport system permease protein
MSTTTPPTIDLKRSWKSRRTLFSGFLSSLIGAMTFLATLPLFSVLFMLVYRGSERLGVSLFTELPPAAGMVGGGIGNAILGTLAVVGIASLISVPVGILAAVYLAEFNPEGRFAACVRFSAKVLSGLPSLLAGVFAYVTVVVTMGKFSVIAGGVALAVLMLPTILLTAENAIRMVAARIREAAIGMGCTESQVVWKVLLPTAFPGILTGVMLAVARAAGETAPLLFTMLFSDYWLRTTKLEPVASLSVLIYDFSGSPYDNQISMAWAASLVLVFLVLSMNIAAQVIAARQKR